MPAVIYTVLRLALFAVATTALWFIGMRSWLAPIGGMFVAWALSYVLLARQGRAAAAWGEQRSAARAGTRRPTAADEDASYEDAIVDAAAPHDDQASTDEQAADEHTPTEHAPAERAPDEQVAGSARDDETRA